MDIFEKAINLLPLTTEEATELYLNYDLSTLMWIANEIRKKKVPGDEVGWIIDRNINLTNICTARCKFCNFHRIPSDKDNYVTTLDEYREKIIELFELGGDQILLQGGLHPGLGLDFYNQLFKQLKDEFPELKLHALGPPEIHFLAKMEKTSYRDVMVNLMKNGLDSLPGAGAEILVDEIRKKISPGKASNDEWLEVMIEAHKLNLPTSATMMYGHVERKEQRIEHLIRIRNVQEKRPEGHYGFVTFVPWTFQAENTRLLKLYPGDYKQSAYEYLKIIAISRIVLNNIENIQASWLTVGMDVAKICLHSGANDLGSIMIEENVVSSAGANYRINSGQIQEAIITAGFKPRRRNQKYETLNPG